jgi:acyl carrier protein
MESRVKITTTVVRELLSDPKVYRDLLPALDDDAEFALDSLGLVWFLHQLELRYGLALEPAEAHLSGFTSIRRITDYLVDVDES